MNLSCVIITTVQDVKSHHVWPLHTKSWVLAKCFALPAFFLQLLAIIPHPSPFRQRGGDNFITAILGSSTIPVISVCLLHTFIINPFVKNPPLNYYNINVTLISLETIPPLNPNTSPIF